MLFLGSTIYYTKFLCLEINTFSRPCEQCRELGARAETPSQAASVTRFPYVTQGGTEHGGDTTMLFIALMDNGIW